MNLKEKIMQNQKLNGIRYTGKETKSETKGKGGKSKKKDKAYTFMAWGAGEESTDNTRNFKYYKGVTPVEIVAFNPDSKKLEEIFGRPQNQEPVYIGTRQWGDKEIQYANCVFFLKTIKDVCGVEKILKLRLQVLNTFFTNKENTKCRVVDIFNRTAWIDKELYKSRGIPMYKNGPAEIDANTYTPLYRGVEELNKFLRAYRGVADVKVYDPETGGMKVNPNLNDAMGTIQHPENLFKGDFSEIIELLEDTQKKATEHNTTQKVKVMIGIRQGSDGRTYQDVYPEEFEKYHARPRMATGLYRNIAYSLQTAKADGRYADTDYYAGVLQECSIEPTTFTPSNASAPSVAPAATVEEPKDDLPW